MKTPHVLDQLPLWVEGDLPGQEMAVVDGHLAQCPTCQEAAEGLKASQAWLREGMASPFEASDRDRFRRAVMVRIREEAAPRNVRPLLIRVGLVAAGAAALLLAALVWHQGSRPMSHRALIEAPLPEVATQSPSSESGPTQAQALIPRRARLPAPHRAQEAESPSQDGPTRIEFQTSDPTVRIIWLAQAKPLPDATHSLSEEP